jgi:hypothetical protein
MVGASPGNVGGRPAGMLRDTENGQHFTWMEGLGLIQMRLHSVVVCTWGVGESLKINCKKALTFQSIGLTNRVFKARNPGKAMKILQQTFVRKMRSFQCMLVVLSLAGYAVQSQGQSYTLNNNNSLVNIDVGSGPGGMSTWQVDGVNQLNLQWFYYRIGTSGPEYPIENLDSTPTISSSGNTLSATYDNGIISVKVNYILTGGSTGSGSSGVAETITLKNISGSALDFHFFQYSDFNLLGALGGQSVQYYTNANGQYYKAVQSSGGWTVTEKITSAAVPIGHVEAGVFANTYTSLTDGSPTILGDIYSAGPDNVTFAYEWDLALTASGSGATKIISKTLELVVPEPSGLALMVSGILTMAVLRRGRRAA